MITLIRKTAYTILRKEKKLGSSRKRSYDIPLDKGSGTGFVVLLIALMTFLVIIALTTSFVLGDMTRRWSSGLENKVTIEIPVKGLAGEARSNDDIASISKRITDVLDNRPDVKGFLVLERDEVSALVSPWLGEDFSLDEIPVPGIISVDLVESEPKILQELNDRVKAIDEFSRLDSHEEWLNDLLGFAGSLKFGAFLLATIIAITTVTAVAGSVRARLALHKSEIELLHIMGAGDRYIAQQFQRHFFMLAVKGAAIGTVVAFIGLLIIKHMSGEMNLALLPEFSMNFWQILLLVIMPVFAGVVAMITALVTVFKALVKMP